MNPVDRIQGEELAEGWYLMSTRNLEELLRTRREGSTERMPRGALRLSTEAALAYRNAGNVPDEQGRTLRLLLRVRDRDEVRQLSAKRARFEPDYHEAPTWRREGSKPVNVVPLRGGIEAAEDRPWWEEPEIAALESEFEATGAVGGLTIPAEYRGFIYKTILSLRTTGHEISVETVASSLARWLPPKEAGEVRAALHKANPVSGS